VRGLLEMDSEIAKDLPALRKFSKEFLAALNDIVTRLEPNQPALCHAEFFIELAARVWKAVPVGGTHAARINATAHGIAHNKVMIIDGKTVITGSFNFTKAAEEKNAENVLITHDAALAQRYSTSPAHITGKAWPTCCSSMAMSKGSPIAIGDSPWTCATTPTCMTRSAGFRACSKLRMNSSDRLIIETSGFTLALCFSVALPR
jgi:hypothetical protein